MTCQSTSTAFSTHWFPHWRHLQSISRHGKLTDFDQLFQLLYYHYYHHHSIFDNIIIILKRKKNYWTWAQLWIRNTLTETSMIDGRQGLLRTSRYLPLDYSYSAQLFHINMNNNNNNKLGARFKKKKKKSKFRHYIYPPLLMVAAPIQTESHWPFQRWIVWISALDQRTLKL